MGQERDGLGSAAGHGGSRQVLAVREHAPEAAPGVGHRVPGQRRTGAVLSGLRAVAGRAVETNICAQANLRNGRRDGAATGARAMSRLDRSMDRVEFQAGLGMHGDESSFASSERDHRGGGQATAARSAAASADSAAHRLRELLAEGSRIREEDTDGFLVAASVGRDSRPSQGSSVATPLEGQVQPGASHAVLSALRSMRERLRASEGERHSLVDQLQAAHDRIQEVRRVAAAIAALRSRLPRTSVPPTVRVPTRYARPCALQLEAELSRIREEGEGWRRSEEAEHRKQLGEMHAELQTVRIQLLETSQGLTVRPGWCPCLRHTSAQWCRRTPIALIAIGRQLLALCQLGMLLRPSAAWSGKVDGEA